MSSFGLLGPCPAVSSTYSSYHSKLFEASVCRAFLCLNLPAYLPACPHTPTAPLPLLNLLHSVQRLHAQDTADAPSLHFTARSMPTHTHTPCHLPSDPHCPCPPSALLVRAAVSSAYTHKTQPLEPGGAFMLGGEQVRGVCERGCGRRAGGGGGWGAGLWE